MTEQPSRRDFLRDASVGAVTLAATSALSASNTQAADSAPPRIRKAVKLGMVRTDGTLAEKFQLLKDLGYDGVEVSAPNSMDTKELLKARDAADLPIHGVVNSVHWRQTLSHPDPNVRAAGLDGFKKAIQAAKDYEASSVLLVPAVVTEDVSYKDAYKRSQAEIRKALPLAEKLDIRILFENVWNNFLLSPLEMAYYIDSFDSPLVGAYFDVGNIVRYGWPTHWVEALGERIGKLDIKEYSRKLQNSKGPRSGFGVEIGEGDCDWPGVMKALDKIGYSGWATAEVRGGDKERLADIKSRMDRVLTFA
ncbi:sugar phosphate isomerase/epimerase family protein [Thalassoroseus pseudoceratinae]|uniref:sugar phosphate isomerase/epimerase family protein n=1 Tax=Thalassoroseus pseudoceratinae TaxID=2713176 RepID=UPI0014238BD5|nr:sugar phosphate isomerase/epimerase family protein [Thalassoroseus pseudoceratinae]